MQRYGNGAFVLLRTPRPGDREVRFRPATDHSMKRPRKEREGDV